MAVVDPNDPRNGLVLRLQTLLAEQAGHGRTGQSRLFRTQALPAENQFRSPTYDVPLCDLQPPRRHQLLRLRYQEQHGGGAGLAPPGADVGAGIGELFAHPVPASEEAIRADPEYMDVLRMSGEAAAARAQLQLQREQQTARRRQQGAAASRPTAPSEDSVTAEQEDMSARIGPRGGGREDNVLQVSEFVQQLF